MARIRYDWEAIQKDYDAGMTYRSIFEKYGATANALANAKKRGALITRSLSEAGHLKVANGYTYSHSVEMKERISEIMRSKMVNRYVASNRCEHNGVKLESSWEKKLAESLDEAGVVWSRPKPILYNDNGQTRRYYPDFYLPDYDVYLDPKNDYVKKLDSAKFELIAEQTDINLKILGKDQLTWEYVKSIL